MKALTGVLLVTLLTACSAPTIVTPAPSASPTASPSTAPAPTPTAQPSITPDGAVSFTTLTAYKEKDRMLTPDRQSPATSLDKTLVIRSQAELDTYLMPDPTMMPEPVDFTRSYVLLTAKLTGAYHYQAQITTLNMTEGNLNADYRFTEVFSPDPMLNDDLRSVITVTRFDRVNYKELKVSAQPILSAE
jgi:hypothetical protein